MASSTGVALDVVHSTGVSGAAIGSEGSVMKAKEHAPIGHEKIIKPTARAVPRSPPAPRPPSFLPCTAAIR